MCVRPHIVSQGAVKCVCETSYSVPRAVLGPSEWTSAWCLSTSAQFPAMTSASCLSTSAQFYFRFPPVCLLPSNFTSVSLPCVYFRPISLPFPSRVFTAAQFHFRFPPVCLLPPNFPPSHHTQVSFSNAFNKKTENGNKKPKMDKKVLKKCGKGVATLQNHGITKQQ